MLTDDIKSAITQHYHDCYPRECCGVIVNDEYIACTNIATDDAQFEICPRDLVRASKRGAIVAYVHSHPDGSTDATMPDRVQMAHHNLPWVITNGAEFAIHNATDYQAPLLGREYHHGLLDCYTLIQDYYARELGIALGDYSRVDRWWESAKAASLYVDNFKAEGFVEVDNLQPHDVLLCRLGRTEHVNHAAVFIGDGHLTSEQTPSVVGDNLILHHPYNRESLREIYGEQWQQRTAMIIRHKSI